MTLILHSCGPEGNLREANFDAASLPEEIVWIDLLAPVADEVALVERATGLRVPTREDLSEIETSSRLRSVKGVLYLSMPAVFRVDGAPLATPLGFVLSSKYLITVRFEPLPAFEAFKSASVSPDSLHPSSAGAFVGLLQALVDRIADVLEQVGGELDAVSHRIFSAQAKSGGAKRAAREEKGLRETMRAIGRSGDLISKLRDSLMGLARIIPYTLGHCTAWAPADTRATLETLRQDVISLSDFDAYLSGKVQLLLDATLGLINIEQNNIMKVLTVVSVVGVPPTLVASWYGMNFKNIPEYDWAFGYQYAIGLALVTTILPLIWFRLRGWF